MTTPFQRYQALLDMRELFFKLRIDIENVPEKIRSEILHINRHFPSVSEFETIAMHLKFSENQMLMIPRELTVWERG